MDAFGDVLGAFGDILKAFGDEFAAKSGSSRPSERSSALFGESLDASDGECSSIRRFCAVRTESIESVRSWTGHIRS